jgi:protocatechuate 3,4-dioxygenase beta subunit
MSASARVVLALGLLAIASPAQQAPEGRIEVTVTDAATGQPVPGAEVVLNFFQSPPPNIVTYAIADGNGRMVFSGLESGDYRITGRHAAYIDDLQARDTVTIGPDSIEHTVRTPLTRGAVISGRVIDPEGFPVVGASVQIHRREYRGGRSVLVRGLSGSVTDDQGAFRIAGIGPAEYFLKVEIHPPEEYAAVDLPRAVYYPGVLSPDSGVPIGVRGSEEIGAIQISVPEVETYTVSGTVINTVPGGRLMPNGQPYRTISSFSLGLRDLSSLEEPYLVSNELNDGMAESALPGDETPFRISGLAPGSYYLYPIFDMGTGTSDGWVTRRTPVEIVDRDVEGVLIVLEAPPDVSGAIAVDGEDGDIDWTQVRVALRAKHSMANLIAGFGGPSATPDPDSGTFTFPNVPEARFGVVVTGLPADAFVAGLRLGSQSIDNSGAFDVTPGFDDILQVVVGRAGGAVSGTVRDGRQNAVPDAGVVLVPSVPRRENVQLYERVTANEQGQFSFEGVRPGDYKVFAWKDLPPGQAEVNPEWLATYESRGQSINVRPGASAVAVQVIEP